MVFAAGLEAKHGMWKRCYSAPNQHGLTPADFHAACDRKGPTLTLAALRDGRRAAAYTPVMWTSGGGYVATFSAMLYSISTGKYAFSTNNQHGMYDSATYHVTFGSGHDAYFGMSGTELKMAGRAQAAS